MTKEKYLHDIIPKIDQAYIKNDMVSLKQLTNELYSSMCFIDDDYGEAHAKTMQFYIENNKIEKFNIVFNRLKNYL